MDAKITFLRMERQYFVKKADEAAYVALYRDTQPGQNVYWQGFGQPPTLVFRTDFNDLEFNRNRQLDRKLVKGRFAGGNLGWIMAEDMELFACLYQKPLNDPTRSQLQLLDLIQREGPMTIQQIKEATGLLVKQITPILHRLQEAFLIYEDQYDGEWDRSWYRFEEMFPQVNLSRYSRLEALMQLIPRLAHRLVYLDTAMLKSFYRIPEKELKAAVMKLVDEGILVPYQSGYLLHSDVELLTDYQPQPIRCVYALHRSDVLCKANEHLLKALVKPLCDGLEYDHETLQYLLIDGEFHGAVVGHFRQGPYDLNDVVCDLPDAWDRRSEILEAVKTANFGGTPDRFLGIPCSSQSCP